MNNENVTNLSSADKENIYQKLEQLFVQYHDLVNVKAIESYEPFVTLPAKGNGVVGEYSTMLDMKAQFPLVPVRTSVAEKLSVANARIQEQHQDYQLVVTYGFRSLEVQTSRFQQHLAPLAENNPILSQDELYEMVHRMIAVPEVAGHPTGGAVDVKIRDMKSGEFLDFWTPQYDYTTKDFYAFSPFITTEQQANRALLRDSMLNAGFAPFDGEWWHFCYGDKEWAFYYNQANAVYTQQTSEAV